MREVDIDDLFIEEIRSATGDVLLAVDQYDDIKDIERVMAWRETLLGNFLIHFRLREGIKAGQAAKRLIVPGFPDPNG